MISGDVGVMSTNDDATISKRYAVSLGYWRDPFIDAFFKNKHPSRLERKTPEINRGYYARVKAIECLIDQFLDYIVCQNEENDQRSIANQTTSKCLKCQIVNIGAGFDTLFWRLTQNKRTEYVKSFVDLDLDDIIRKKRQQVLSNQELFKSLGDDVSFNELDIHSNVYHLVSSDLRNIAHLNEKLFNKCQLDKNLPTLFISECVLVYLSNQNVRNFLNSITSNFQRPVILNYEQVNMTDKFGEIMIENLRMRDCEIMDLESCKSLENQRQKYLNCGFTNVNAWTMQTIYSFYIDQQDKERIERIEFLDEANLLEQLLNHYSITIAYKGFEQSIQSIDSNTKDEPLFGFI